MKRIILNIVFLLTFSIFIVSCGDGGDSGCQDFCSKAEDCLGTDTMEEMGGMDDCVNGCSQNNTDWKECMLDCDNAAVCEDWKSCVNNCGGFTIPDGDET